jgi:hypothetical protein
LAGHVDRNPYCRIGCQGQLFAAAGLRLITTIPTDTPLVIVMEATAA